MIINSYISLQRSAKHLLRYKQTIRSSKALPYLRSHKLQFHSSPHSQPERSNSYVEQYRGCAERTTPLEYVSQILEPALEKKESEYFELYASWDIAYYLRYYLQIQSLESAIDTVKLTLNDENQNENIERVARNLTGYPLKDCIQKDFEIASYLQIQIEQLKEAIKILKRWS